MKIIKIIQKIIRFPFIVIYRILDFLLIPFTIIIGFIITDFEDKFHKNYYFKALKKGISFGFWKE